MHPDSISSTNVIQSPYPAEEVLRIIDSSVLKTRAQANMGNPNAIGGRVQVASNKFVLTKFSNMKNGFARDLHGIVHAGQNGSTIEYGFEVSIIVRSMFACWSILVIILFLAGLFQTFTGTPRLELILGPVLLLGGGVWMVSTGMNRGRAQEQDLVRFLKHITRGA